jgi:adenosylcobinamide-phosphate synthase
MLWSILVLPGAALIALALDVLFGEPPASLHPVVWMGQFLNRMGRDLPDMPPRRAFIAGTIAWLLGAVILTASAWAIELALLLLLRSATSWRGTLAASVALGILLKPLLAMRMLFDEVQSVETALNEGIEAGRLRVSRLASRDTLNLDSNQVRETAIESLAENLNDSVIAPLFWFCVAGLPGAVLYRYANTADAMWGYRGRWEWAGKWAARADDALSWIPARLTALVLAPPSRWADLLSEARRTPSPNGGWPMGAMALRLGVRLRKPAVYELNPRGRFVTQADVPRAVRIAARAIWLILFPMLGVAIILGALR